MQQIDIRKVIGDKSPKALKWTPKWLVRWVEKLLRVKRLNYILSTFGHLPAYDFVGASLRDIGVDYRLYGTENIPKNTDNLVFAANHPLGGIDGLILAHALGASHNLQNSSLNPTDSKELNGTTEIQSSQGVPLVKNLKLIVNDLLMHLDPLTPIFVPVNKFGKQRGHYAQTMTQTYQSPNAIITFPAGLVSRLIDGKIEDPQWQPSFVTRAINSERTIVPVYIDGANSKGFYRLAVWRKRLKIKVNLEIFTLPKEMFDQKGKTVSIYFGKPVTPDKSRTAEDWCQEIRQQVYNLKQTYSTGK